jgi:hypothetical protein
MRNFFYSLIIANIFIISSLHSSEDQPANIDFMKDFMQKEVNARSVASAATAPSVETHCIKYATAEDGSHMHFGIWSDCIIGTVIGNAPNIGTQVIMWNNGVIFDVSTRYSKHTKYFTNKYNWGHITSYDYKQVIKNK